MSLYGVGHTFTFEQALHMFANYCYCTLAKHVLDTISIPVPYFWGSVLAYSISF